MQAYFVISAVVVRSVEPGAPHRPTQMDPPPYLWHIFEELRHNLFGCAARLSLRRKVHTALPHTGYNCGRARLQPSPRRTQLQVVTLLQHVTYLLLSSCASHGSSLPPLHHAVAQCTDRHTTTFRRIGSPSASTLKVKYVLSEAKVYRTWVCGKKFFPAQ